jgi:beta-glucosidase
VVVLIAGSAVTMEEWQEQPEAILMSWFHGMEGGNALARVLFGDVNPGGRLPVTIPRDLADLPTFDPFAFEADYGYYHGYTLLDREGKQAAFPFGSGLSYTSFAYDAIEVLTPEIGADGTLEVTVEVTNTGEVAGEEVVQLYIGFEGSRIERPIKLLRGFERVALRPGETRTVRFAVPASDLAWYDPERKAWQVERMTYDVLIGPSSQKASLLRSSFRVL